MRLSKYGILEDDDIFQEGDETRCATPYSQLTQLADVELDVERMRWRKVYPYWIGKKFGTLRKAMRGSFEGRRLLSNEELKKLCKSL